MDSIDRLRYIEEAAEKVVKYHFAFGHACGPGIPTFIDLMIDLKAALEEEDEG